MKISELCIPTVFDDDSEGNLFPTDEDRDTISSLGEHITQPSSAIKACPSLHSYFPLANINKTYKSDILCTHKHTVYS